MWFRKNKWICRENLKAYIHYQRSHSLISVGACIAGTDPELDRAIRLYPELKILNQNMSQQENFDNSLEKLTRLLGNEVI